MQRQGFQRTVLVFELLVQQAHFQHVVDAPLDFDLVKRFGYEIFRAGGQRPQLVARLGRDREDWRITLGFDVLQAFHHLETIHAGHLQIEQNQVVVVGAMQRADGMRIHRGRMTSTMDPHTVCTLHRANHYDLILLDLQMPGMDGFQVMEGLKDIETEGYTPILAITAQPGHKLRALASGAKDFVAKPFYQVEVKRRIYNMLEVRLLY